MTLSRMAFLALAVTALLPAGSARADIPNPAWEPKISCKLTWTPLTGTAVSTVFTAALLDFPNTGDPDVQVIDLALYGIKISVDHFLRLHLSGPDCGGGYCQSFLSVEATLLRGDPRKPGARILGHQTGYVSSKNQLRPPEAELSVELHSSNIEVLQHIQDGKSRMPEDQVQLGLVPRGTPSGFSVSCSVKKASS